MYKVTIKRPSYLSEEVFITPDSSMLSHFICDKLSDLNRAEDKDLWYVVISPTDIRYLGEYLE